MGKQIKPKCSLFCVLYVMSSVICLPTLTINHALVSEVVLTCMQLFLVFSFFVNLS